jgi:F-type H+-transporting ATPase subunit b
MAISLLHDGALASLASASAGSSGGVTVDLDITFVAQVVLFILLFLVLRPLLFEPMMRLFDERERRIDGAKKEAREMYAEADQKMAKYEEELADVKREAGEEREKLRGEGHRREQAILAKVRTETNATVEQGRETIQREAEALRKELTVAAQSLSREIAGRVLGREVQP